MAEINSAAETAPELEARLNTLNHEIDELTEHSHDIGRALDRCGVSDVPCDGETGQDKAEPQTFLERLDDALERLNSLRENCSNHATRCRYMV